MNMNRGYHSNKEVSRKDCWVCHGEHYGRTFQIVRFDEQNFDHNESGFELVGSHLKLDCDDCHNHKNILGGNLTTNRKTFLGLSNKCNTCHEDIHQGTLNDDCSKCHTEEKFSLAVNFSHNQTNFILEDSHLNVNCEKCHIKERRNNKPFQRFAGVQFGSCSNCHVDVHKGKFGKDCQSCHNTGTFQNVKIANGFNHSRTNYPLIGQHMNVKCENCHKGSLANKPEFANCYNCHEDYHEGEFVKDNTQTDCKDCHNEDSFSPSTFTVNRHAFTQFKLEYAHAATPCTGCHLHEERWEFNRDGRNCIACHTNIHGDEISPQFFDEKKCETCHSTWSWQTLEFDHKTTNFELLGSHSKIECSKCHSAFFDGKTKKRKFKELSTNCSDCHKDVHNGQFTEDKIDLCADCHKFDNWRPTLFDHSATRFSLRGAHKEMECKKCHTFKSDEDMIFVNYKIKETTCKSCHS